METDNMPSTSKAGMDDDDDKDVVQQYINSSGVVLDREEFMESCGYDPNLEDEISSEREMEHEKGDKMMGISSTLHLEDVNLETLIVEEKNEQEDPYRKRKDFNVSVHSKDQKYKCRYCHFSTILPSWLKAHVESVHVEDKSCELSTVSEPVPLNSEENEGGHCESSNFSLNGIKKHPIFAHYSNKKYECELCDYSSFYLQNLKTHFRAVHIQEKKYDCEYCPFSTCNSKGLKNHVRCIHSGNKKYKCKFCNFKTVYRNNLKSHVRTIHNKEKNYYCEYCAFSTVHLSHLKKHVKRVHVKIYKCEICDFDTLSSSDFSSHMICAHSVRQEM